VNAIVVVGLVAMIGCVLWFLLGRSPERAATHEGDPLPRDQRAARDLAGPADGGAEGMATPAPGEVGPRDQA